MNRTSKITRLPETLREELNQRLRNGEPANNLLLGPRSKQGKNPCNRA